MAKTVAEIELEALLDAYLERFKRPYPLGIMNNVTDEEMRTEIERALETGKPVKEPKPRRGVLY